MYFAGHGKKYIPVERLNIRSFALGPPAFYIGNMTQPPALFDPYLHHANRLSEDALFLHKHAAEELYDRLKMVNKTFTKVAIVTGHGVVFDNFQLTADIIAPQDTLDLGAGEYDLILHFMALHRQNDPVGQLIQINRALRPDGLFLGACFGGKSLEELRAALLQADSRINNGAAPRVAPMMDIRDAGALMQRAGFAMPVVDSEETNITYADLKRRSMISATWAKEIPLRRVPVISPNGPSLTKRSPSCYPRTKPVLGSPPRCFSLAAGHHHRISANPSNPDLRQYASKRP